MNAITNPYIGPRTFTEDERDRFFGREREANELLTRVLTEQETVFYAQSGAGKSSLVNTCLVPDLRKNGFEVLQGRVGGDAPPGLEIDNIFVFNLLRSLSPGDVRDVTLSKRSLHDFLMPKADISSAVKESAPRRRALIIDQFEEIFRTHDEAWEKRRDFFEQLAQTLEADARLRVILVMREDNIAYLDPYAGLLPGRLQMRYYMQRLKRDAALAAIKKPVENFCPFAEGVAEQLVDDLCSVKVYLPDGTAENRPGQYVEPVQLQVVCYNLWEKIRKAGGKQITEKDLLGSGDVDASLGDFFAERVKAVAETKKFSERKIREWFTKKLISPGGVRNMVLRESGGKSGGLEEEIIQALHDLVRGEQRGGAVFYELTHDRLVKPIIANNEKWDEENSSRLRKRALLWNEEGRNKNQLLTDDALEEAEQWVAENKDELTDLDNEFLEECRKNQEQIDADRETQRRELEMANELASEQAASAKRARNFNIVSGFLSLIVITVAIFAYFAKLDADKNAKDAIDSQNEAQLQSNLARSGELSTVALDRSNSQLDLAILLGVQAYSIDPTNPLAQKNLLVLLQKSYRYRGSIKDAENIKDIQYSPDGNVLASLDDNGIVFWNADTRKPLNNTPINGHFNGITALALSKDGKLLASGATDGTIVIWDVDNRRMLSKPFKAHQAQISSLAFNADGNTLASGSYDYTIKLWNTSDPKFPEQIGESLTEHTNIVLCLTFSPDGKILASGGYDNTIILWDVETREPFEHPIKEHGDWVNVVAFNSKGTFLASASDDSRVILWNVEDPDNPSLIKELQNVPRSYVRGLAISPDDLTLASGNFDGSIVLWNIKDPENPEREDKTISQRFGSGYNIPLAFSADNKTLVSGTEGGAFALWNVAGKERINNPSKGGSSFISSIIFEPNKNSLIIGSSDSTITFWDVSNPAEPRKNGEPLRGHPGQPTSMKFSPDGSLLTSTGNDGSISILLDVKSRKQIGIGSTLTSPDKTILAFQTLDDTTNEHAIHLRSTGTSAEIGSPIPGQNPIFSPDSQTLVYQTLDQDTGQTLINLWNINTAKNIITDIEGEYLAFSSDSQILVYRTADQETGHTFINFFNITEAENIGEAIEGSYWAFNSDNQVLVYQSTDPDTGQTFINLWDAKTANRIGDGIQGYPQPIGPDSQALVYLTYDSESGATLINLLDINTGTPLIEPVEGNFERQSENGNILLYSSSTEGVQFTNVLNTSTGETISSVENSSFYNFIESGHYLAYEIYDAEKEEYYVKLVNTETGYLEGPLQGHVLYLTPDGKYLIYGSEDGSGSKINLWDITNNYPIAGPLNGSYKGIFNDNQILVYQSVEGDANYVNLFDMNKTSRIGEPIRGVFQGYSPNGDTLITRNEYNTIVFWDITKNWPFGDPVEEVADKASSAALSMDGKTLVFADINGITLQDTTTDKIIRKLKNEHVGTITGASLSPDQDRLATFGNDGKTIVWDLNTFQRLSYPITGTYASFSPNERYIAVIDYVDNTTVVWDLTNQQIVSEPLNGQNVTYSPNERFVAVGNSNENTVVVWDLIGQRIVGEPFSGQLAIFSPDERFVVIVDYIGNTIFLWDLINMEPVGDALPGSSAQFSLDGSILAIVDSINNTITLWDLTTQTVIGEPFAGSYVQLYQEDNTLGINLSDYTTYTDSVALFDLVTRQLVVNPFQGSILSTPGTNEILAIVNTTENTTTLWNSGTQAFDGTSIRGTDASFTQSKINILVVRDNQNNTTTLWNPATREQIGETLSGYYYPSLSPGGTLISMADSDNNTTIFWDLESNKQIGEAINGYYNPYICVDNKTVAWIDSNGTTITFWNLEKNRSLGKFESSESIFSYNLYLTFNSRCDTVAIINNNQNQISLLDIANMRLIDDFPIKGSTAYFSSDGFTVAIGDYSQDVTTFWNLADAAHFDKEVPGGSISVHPNNIDILTIQSYDPQTGFSEYTIWDLKSLSQIGDVSSYYPPTITSDGIVITYNYNGIHVWDMSDDISKPVDQLHAHTSPISGLLFSQDGNYLASLARDGIILTNLVTQSSTRLGIGEYSGQITSKMAFPNGRHITALGTDNKIFIWDIPSTPPTTIDPRQVNAPYTNAYRTAFSPDGKYLIYEDYNNELFIWDIDSKQPFGEPVKIETCCGGAIAFTPDGSTMFYNDGRTIIRWDHWNDAANSSKTGLSFGRNTFFDLHVIMDPEHPDLPKYLLAKSFDQSGTTITQILDWSKNSIVGDPISGNIQIYGSSVENDILIYKDNDGRLINFDLTPTVWQDLLCERAGRNLTREEWKFFLPESIEYPIRKDDITCPKLPTGG